jgi:hypothetical protein
MANFFAGFGGGGGGGGSNPNIQIPGLQQATDQLTQLNTAVSGLNQSLQNLANQQQRLGQQIGGMFNQIGNQANQAANNVNQANAAMQSTVQSTSGGSGVVNKLFGVASAAAGSDILKDLAMFPLRFITQTLGTNRQLSMNMQSQLSGQMFATGAQTGGPNGIATNLARFPGDVRGSPEDLINLMGIARSAGAMMDLGTARQGSARTTGFLSAVQQMQMITPATPVGAMAGAVAQQLQPGQQQQAYLTGGAFNMIGRGGKVKSLSEWAEGILRWVEGMRPPPDTGKPFDYGQLLAQYFPGSNIDAWLTTQGITPDMKEYWWDYSLGKANRTNSTQGKFIVSPVNQFDTARGGNQPWERLQAVSAKGRGELSLAGTMAGSYSNKEESNRWFNDLMANVMSRVIPAQTSKGALSVMQYLPDQLEELLMGLLERGGPIGALLGGGIGYGLHGVESLTKGLIGGLTAGTNMVLPGGMDSLMQLFEGSFTAGGGVVDAVIKAAGGDEPDGLGDSPGMEWGMMGTSSTAGLHPDMKRKVDRMMKANPKLRVNSGLRDTVTQQNLKAKGFNKVSGRPSAHTRGLAADLGPASQYGWLMKNAGKFGLRSGKGFGEPWHVGLGDAPGVGDTPPPDDPYSTGGRPFSGNEPFNDFGTPLPTWSTDPQAVIAILNAHAAGVYPGIAGAPGVGHPDANAPAPADTVGTGAEPNPDPDLGKDPLAGLGAIFNLFKGGLNRDTAITAIGGIVPAVMSLFLGTFGMDDPNADLSSLNFDPTLYGALVGAAGTFHFGGLQSQGMAKDFSYGKSFGSKIGGGGLNNSGGGGGGGGGATSSGASTLTEALKNLGIDATGLSTGAMVAKIAHAAGFSNSAIPTVVGIAKRESDWNPSAHNTNAGTGDNSYGLTQINMLGSLGPERQKMFGIGSYDELLDPYVNLKAMYTLSGSGSDFNPWLGYRAGLHLSETNQRLGLEAAKEAGYGDIPSTNEVPYLGPDPSYAQHMLGSGPVGSSGGMVFHNQFVINAAGGPPSSNGIDVRRVVAQMADQLEDQMKKRMVRSN